MSKKYWVYVLGCHEDGRIYIGCTQDLKYRLRQHNGNRNRSTRNRGPWKILRKELFKTRSEAMKRERFLKSGSGREYLRTGLVTN